MIRAKKLKQVYKTPRNNGIFFSMSQDTELSSFFERLGINTEADYHSIDFDYLLNHSGEKTCSLMVQDLISGLVNDEEGDLVIDYMNRLVSWDYVMTDVDKTLINFVIKTKFLKKWNGLADTLELKYNPLTPFSMDISETTGNTLKSSEKGSSTNNDTTDSESSNEGTANENDSRHGFNSTQAVPTTESEQHSTSNGTSKVTSEGQSSRLNDYESQRDGTREITRSGNIGNRSSQQLIEEQRKVLFYQILDTVYVDLDSVLTRSKYII